MNGIFRSTRKLFTGAMALAVAFFLVAPAFASYTLLFSPATSPPRTINWSYDGSCSSAMLPKMQSEFRKYDRVLDNVTINYLGLDGTGHNRTDTKSTVSCHTKAWMEARGAWPAGAYVDHDVVAGARTFEMVFCEDNVYCVDAGVPWGFGAALHEGGHVLGLNHPANTSANNWSAVFGAPFCWASPSTCNTYHTGWTEYLSNDDLVGLSTYYQEAAADCTPYLSTTDKLYVPYIPATASGFPDPTTARTGYWAVFQLSGPTGGNRAATLLQWGAAHTYKYDCSMAFIWNGGYGGGALSAYSYKGDSTTPYQFIMVNNSSSPTNLANWTYLEL
jgi:hypothetical protein